MNMVAADLDGAGKIDFLCRTRDEYKLLSHGLDSEGE